MSNPFIFKPAPEEVEGQVEAVGVPPRDMVEPFNYPYKLLPLWRVFAVEGNLWRVRLAADQALLGTGTDVDTSVAEGEFYFHHVVRDVYLYQFDAAGARNDDALTWEFGRAVGGDYQPIRAGADQPELDWAVESLMYRTNGENYRFRLEGTATNTVTVEMWIEVLRI